MIDYIPPLVVLFLEQRNHVNFKYLLALLLYYFKSEVSALNNVGVVRLCFGLFLHPPPLSQSQY